MLDYTPTWLEEPVPAMQLNGYVRVKQATGIPLAGGEHLYSRWDVLPFLQAGAVDFVQTDPEWAGGISELTRICAMAGAYGVKVCPHGHTVVTAPHVIASQPESICPIQEYLFSSAERRQCFFKDPLVPVGGFLPLPTRPGLGVELDEAKIESRKEVSWA
jgi:L-alanine-DL-glutamate epimerase-like enolase superfamily enzyme